MILADYKKERGSFSSLLADQCDHRILFFEGASGTGKTSLLRLCGSQVPRTFAHIPIQLRGTAVGIAEIFYRSGTHIGWSQLSRFAAEVDNLGGKHRIEIEGNKILGINNRIAVALHADNPDDREVRRVALTDALFEDVETMQRPLLFLFDTYEQSTTEVQQWISGPFLARAARLEHIRVLIAGQTVPNTHNIEWGTCSKLHQLIGVPEAEDWLPVIQEMGKVIPRVAPTDSPLTWLAGVCYALKGDPSKIMQAIEALPPRREPS